MKLPALLRHVVIISLVFAVGVSVFAPFTQAASYAPIPQRSSDNALTESTNADVADTVHNRAQIVFIEAINTLVCQLAGVDMINPSKPCLTIDVTSGKIGYGTTADTKRAGGLLGQMAYMIGGTYDLPIHTTDYTQYMAQNFGISKTAYAQSTGNGFDSLKPLLSMWTRMRDLCYLAFVIIFVIIGFGIMLRIKIDPRTVMAVQNQIPRVIIAILLITFSYAIAGILVDAMWVVTYIGINVLTTDPICQGGSTATALATNNLLTDPMHYVSAIFGASWGCSVGWGGIYGLANNVGQTVGDIIVSLIGTIFTGGGTGNGGGCGLTNLFSQSGQMECVRYIISGFFSFLVGLLATLIIIIAIFVQLFRVWFALLKTYFYVIMYVLLGPFYILLGLVPGTQSFGFGQWVRYLASGLTAFPTTAFIYVAALVVANNADLNSSTAQHFVPPLIGNPNVSNNIGMLVGLGAILIAPEITNLMRGIFKTTPSKYVPQMFAGAATGAAMVGAPVGAAYGRLTARNSAGQATGPLSYYGDVIKGRAIRSLGINKRSWFKNTAAQQTRVILPSEPEQKVGAAAKPDAPAEGSGGDS